MRWFFLRLPIGREVEQMNAALFLVGLAIATGMLAVPASLESIGVSGLGVAGGAQASYHLSAGVDNGKPSVSYCIANDASSC